MVESRPRGGAVGAGASRSRSRRFGSKGTLLALIAVAGGLALVSATQMWVVIALVDGAAATSSLQISGQQLNPSISPVAIAALASVLALTIAGRKFRYVLGALVALLGAGIATLGVIALLDPRTESEWSIGEATGIIGDSQYELIRAVSVTAWPSVAIMAGAVLVLAGICVVLLGGRWAAGGRKYEATTAPDAESRALQEPGKTSDTSRAAEPTDRDRISDWDTMTNGADPTQ